MSRYTPKDFIYFEDGFALFARLESGGRFTADEVRNFLCKVRTLGLKKYVGIMNPAEDPLFEFTLECLGRFRQTASDESFSTWVLRASGKPEKIESYRWGDQQFFDDVVENGGQDDGGQVALVIFRERELNTFLAGGSAGSHESIKTTGLPYLDFMNRMAAELEIPRPEDETIDQLVEELRKHLPPELQDTSERMLRNMATMLRPKEASRGGNKRFKKG
ncbi:MAG: hypothetical protein KDF64_03945 [Geminicoccaceae bacterium]|nr:hypothetical protein [Geminicoccaceae bacterium]